MRAPSAGARRALVGDRGVVFEVEHVTGDQEQYRELLLASSVVPTQSLQAGIVTAVVFLVYTQLENHVLDPAVVSQAVRVNALLVFVQCSSAAASGRWIGGLFGGFSAALLAIPVAAAMQVIAKDLWGTQVVAAQAPTPARTDDPVA